jgi:hypothetical protein
MLPTGSPPSFSNTHQFHQCALLYFVLLQCFYGNCSGTIFDHLFVWFYHDEWKAVDNMIFGILICSVECFSKRIRMTYFFDDNPLLIVSFHGPKIDHPVPYRFPVDIIVQESKAVAAHQFLLAVCMIFTAVA